MKLSSPATFFFLLAASTSKVAQAYTDSALFRQTFEDPTVDDWDFSNHIRVQDYSSGGTSHGRTLRVSYPPDPRGSPRITERFDIEQVTSATLSFDIKLHSQFEFVKGGKMHGLGGGTTTTGCDDIDLNGWSVRLTWKDGGVPRVYVYHQDREARCGDGYAPTNGFAFERSTWYRVDLQVEMNSSPESNDGKAVLYIDGDKLVEVNDLRLSGNANVDIDKFLFSTFYGGSSPEWAPSQTTHIYWDNFTVNRGLVVTGNKGTECEIFLGGIYSPSKDVCCDNLCGSCGGSGCGSLTGGSGQCCTGKIDRDGIMCDQVANAPCNFDG